MTPYDAMRLTAPEQPDPIGIHAGECCNRIHEPDEDAPKGYRPKPCSGEMTDSDGVAVCDTCGEVK